MAISVDTQRRSFGSFGFDSMPSFPSSRPFTDSWTSSSSPASTSAASATALHSSLFGMGFDPFPKHAAGPRVSAGGVSMPYTTVPVSAPSVSSAAMPVSYGTADMLNLPNQLLSPPRLANESTAPYPSDLGYSTAPSPRTHGHMPAPISASAPSSFDSLVCASTRTAYAPQAPPAAAGAGDRRWSQPAVPPPLPPTNGFLAAPVDDQRPRQGSLGVDVGRGMAPSPVARDDYTDAMSAGRGLMLLEDNNVTPRNIYDVQAREPTDSYGFPTTQSSASSMSSPSPYTSLYGSVDSSVSGYSSTAESVDSVSSRGMHRPQGSLSSSMPPAPQSMMGQFNSKVSSSAQKKHRCRVCDKRFTRPSSLRTHMYSHTGEKPFSCDVEGCGRNFSVVSNLRRHRKVHRGEREVSSPEEC